MNFAAALCTLAGKTAFRVMTRSRGAASLPPCATVLFFYRPRYFPAKVARSRWEPDSVTKMGSSSLVREVNSP